VEKSYRVIFEELLGSRDDFERHILSSGLNHEQIGLIFDKAPVVLKAGLPLKEARKYAEVFQTAGAKIQIQENGVLDSGAVHKQKIVFEVRPLQDFTRCPQCGHKQLKARNCQRCGLELTDACHDK
jgi:hypothetical protein